jgi:hypothetical protein
LYGHAHPHNSLQETSLVPQDIHDPRQQPTFSIETRPVFLSRSNLTTIRRPRKCQLLRAQHWMVPVHHGTKLQSQPNLTWAGMTQSHGQIVALGSRGSGQPQGLHFAKCLKRYCICQVRDRLLVHDQQNLFDKIWLQVRRKFLQRGHLLTTESENRSALIRQRDSRKPHTPSSWVGSRGQRLPRVGRKVKGMKGAQPPRFWAACVDIQLPLRGSKCKGHSKSEHSVFIPRTALLHDSSAVQGFHPR